MNDIRIYLLLGGFFGWDGVVTSAGMYGLKKRLEAAVDKVTVRVYNWDKYREASRDAYLLNDSKTVFVGYSGGGWAEALACNYVTPRVDLLIAYDPSPWWKLKQPEAMLHINVRRAITYQNKRRSFPSPYGYLGGGVLLAGSSGPEIERVPIDENHAMVQFDSKLHDRTIEEVRKLAS
jgi:hypothetical protein